MKKSIAVVLMAMIMAVTVFGCSSKDALQGTKWTLVSGEKDGQKASAEQLKSVLGEFTFEFKKDGVITLNAQGEESQGKYKVDGKKVTISDDNQKVDGTIDGDKLTIEYEGVKMELQKSK